MNTVRWRLAPLGASDTQAPGAHGCVVPSIEPSPARATNPTTTMLSASRAAGTAALTDRRRCFTGLLCTIRRSPDRPGAPVSAEPAYTLQPVGAVRRAADYDRQTMPGAPERAYPLE